MRKNKLIKVLFWALCSIALIIAMMVTASAHSGRTDSRGGHKDNKNVSGLGNYHYHCGGYSAHLHTSGYCPYTDVFPTSVSVSSEKTEYAINDVISLSTTVYPSNACNTNVSYESSNPSVVKVLGSTLKAVGNGTSVITAKSFNGKTSTITITVKEVEVASVTISRQNTFKETYYIGDELTLVASVLPENAENKVVYWESSDSTIATVQDGKVSLLSKGIVQITAKTENGISDTFTIVVAKKEVESITLDSKQLSLKIGKTSEIAVSVYPVDATDKALEWASSDDSVARVNNGIVWAIGEGTVTITVTATNGVSASIELDVVSESKDTLSNIETDNNRNDAKTDVDMVSGKDDAEEDSGDFGTVAGAGVLVGIGYLVLRKKSKKKK